MGGRNSGNSGWRYDRKEVVEDCRELDAARWTREGILRQGVCHSGTWHWTYRGGRGFWVSYLVNTVGVAPPTVRLSYSWTWRSTGKEESAAYPVRLTATRPG